MTDKYLAHFITEIRGYCTEMQQAVYTLCDQATSCETIRTTAQELQRITHTIAGLSGSLEIGDFAWLSEGLEACCISVAADPANAEVAALTHTLAGLLDQIVAYFGRRVDLMEAAGTFQAQTSQQEVEYRALEEQLWQLGGKFSGTGAANEAAGELSEEDRAILRAFAESDLAATETGALQPGGVATEQGSAEAVSAEMLELFRVETEDDLRQLQSALARLELPEERPAAVLEMRRAAHKIKGAAATLDLQAIAGLAHGLEDLLDALMNQHLEYTPAVLDALLRGLDEMEAALRRIAAGEPEQAEAVVRLQAEYEAMLGVVRLDRDDPEATQPDSRRLSLAVQQQVDSSASGGISHEDDAPSLGGWHERSGRLREHEQTLRVDVRKLDHIMGLVSELAVNRTGVRQARQEISDLLVDLRRALHRMGELVGNLEEETGWLRMSPSQLAGESALMSALAPSVQGAQPENQDEEPTLPRGVLLRGTSSHPRMQRASSRPLPEEGRLAQGSPVRGTPSRPLNPSSALASEHARERESLELERFDSEYSHLVHALKESVTDVSTLGESVQRLLLRLSDLADTQETLTSTIQRDITHLRLVPIRQVIPRLQLTARMVAQEQNKQINFHVKGEATEIDRDIIEAITGPLAQLVRNCAVHGIEPVEERRAQGKPDAGNIWFQAYYSGNEVSIEVGDDGRGINYQRLVAAALASGKITPEEAGAMTPDEAVNLMLLPDVSTSPEVTTIAGRGVGMDMVRTVVEGLRGTLHIHNRPGEGAMFHIRLPISLGVMVALLVRAGQQTYAVPLSAIERVLPPEHQNEQDTVPVFKLTALLGMASRSGADEGPEGAIQADGNTLYVSVGRRMAGVQVDEVLHEREVVVKRLPTHLRRRGVRGVTFSSAGEVLLLLDLPELVHRALGSAGSTQPVSGEVGSTSAEPARTEQVVLVVDDSAPLRRTLELQLTRAGYQVMTARDGVEALEAITTKRRPSLVLLDIEMPRMDGYELLSLLRSQALYRALPVVMLTSRAGEKHRLHAMNLGATAYLVKPCPHDELLETIARLTQHG